MSIKAIKNKPISNWIRYKLIWNSPLVFLVFLVVDFICYGLIWKTNPYTDNLLHKLIWMAVLALFYTQVYHKACYSWWWINWEKIKKVRNLTYGQFDDLGEATKEEINKEFFGKNLWSSVVFGLFIGIVLIAAIALSHYLVSVIYLYILDGIRGIPETLRDDAILVGQTVGAGAALSICGKDESEGERDP